ncbi:hypothetical protein CB1_000590002 [Camelus ferus]|nr:hypothetical protein CB1_000590002 [Camelus ferus]
MSRAPSTRQTTRKYLKGKPVSFLPPHTLTRHPHKSFWIICCGPNLEDPEDPKGSLLAGPVSELLATGKLSCKVPASLL